MIPSSCVIKSAGSGVPHKSSPLLIVLAYAPTDQDSTKEKDQLYSDLDRVMSNGNGLAMVMRDFDASVSERMKRVVEPHGLGRHTSDNGERLISFVTANGMCISNTFFSHTHPSSIMVPLWPNMQAKP